MKPSAAIVALAIVCCVPSVGICANERNTSQSQTGRWFKDTCDTNRQGAQAEAASATSMMTLAHCLGYTQGLSDMLSGSISLVESVTQRRNPLGICLPSRGMSGGMWNELLLSYLARHPDRLDTSLRMVMLLAAKESFPCADGAG
jgi:hypothetical protein